MNSKKDRYLIIGSLIAVLLVAFVACAASRDDKSSGDAVSVSTTPTETPSRPAEPLAFTVTSVKGKRVEGYNCVIAQVLVTNNKPTSIAGKLTSFPSPFTLVNAEGDEIHSITKYLSLDGSILPGQQGPGSITFCAADITRGSRVTLHHGTKEWMAVVPKPKPKRDWSGLA